MSNELQAIAGSGLTLYAVLVNSIGQIWNTSGTPAFETYNGANWTDYDIALTEAGAGIYFANMPAVVAGNYSYLAYERAGVSPATTDTLKGTGSIAWSGTVEIIPAAVGAKMDLIDAPNATAITAIQNGLATPANVNTEVVDALTVDVIADSVATDGTRPTIAQALLMISRFLMEKSVSGVTVTVNKENGSTSSMTFTLNDASNPTAITRAS